MKQPCSTACSRGVQLGKTALCRLRALSRRCVPLVLQPSGTCAAAEGACLPRREAADGGLKQAVVGHAAACKQHLATDDNALEAVMAQLAQDRVSCIPSPSLCASAAAGTLQQAPHCLHAAARKCQLASCA